MHNRKNFEIVLVKKMVSMFEYQLELLKEKKYLTLKRELENKIHSSNVRIERLRVVKKVVKKK